MSLKQLPQFSTGQASTERTTEKMISLDKQVEILAQLSIGFQETLTRYDENWKEFFNMNNLAVPFATLNWLGLAEWPQSKDEKRQIEMLVRTSFFELCEELNLERGRKHLSINDMFRSSPNASIPLFDEDTLKEIETL